MEREIPGDADVAEGVGAVRREAELEDRVAEPERIGDGRAGGGRRDRVADDEDARRADADVELLLGADHPARNDAAELALADLHPVGELRADPGEEDAAARLGDVGRAADDLDRAGSVVDRDLGELVFFRDLLLVAHLGDDDRVEAFASRLDRFDLEAAAGELLGHLRGRRIDAGQLLQPLIRSAHQSCSRKRTSFS